ncbi:hypothetical protein MTR_6g011520 [Medicago truncatula]|uniref:Uncharacterized protein n=1 Tax=Medicago truncatula TaxID=3880 RepID=A0A072U6J1_MEDTR|nr:hypothetical protein MTR_6g011520 [Medicago truncatula]
MLVEKERLWYRVLKARYGKGGLSEGDRHASVWWKSICRVRDGVSEGVGRWFDENIRRVAGDGRDTLFWYDNWIGDILLWVKYPRLFDLAVDKECKDNGHDYWWWLLDDPAHGYSVKASYHYITTTCASSDRSRVDDIW